ncbi:MAG: thioredoxin family protein [Acidobacteriota bacterium]
MERDSVIVMCSRCRAKNRVPRSRLEERPICGKCKTPLSAAFRFPDAPIDISDSRFKNEVLDFPGPVMVYIWATWCGYCRQMTPIVDRIAAEYAGRVKIVKMVMDQNPLTASHYGIQAVPAFLLFKAGSQVDKAGGAMPKEELERHLGRIL